MYFQLHAKNNLFFSQGIEILIIVVFRTPFKQPPTKEKI